MVDTIRIKRRLAAGGAGAPSTLANAELAYNEASNILYYGAGGTASAAASIIAISGTGAYLPLTGGTVTGSTVFTGGITFGSTSVSGATLSNHIALFGTTFGFNVVPATIQIVSNGNVALQATGGLVTIPINFAVTGTSTLTGLATFNGGLTSTAGITVNGSNSSFATPAAFTAGITFGSTATTGVDLSKHIALWGSTYGINVISATMQLISNGNAVLQATSATVTVPVNLSVTGNTVHTGTTTTSGAMTIGGSPATGGGLFVNTNYGGVVPTTGNSAICWNMTGGSRDMDFVNTFATAGSSFRFYQVTTAVPAAWAANTAYAVNAIVLNSQNVYTCTVAGTSAASGGPTGTGSGIVDNTVTWNWVSGAVAYSTTLLQQLTTTTATFYENVNVTTGGTTSLYIDGATGNAKSLNFRTAGVTHWQMGQLQDAESGSNAGASFYIGSYSDTGTFLGFPIQITRATGLVTIGPGGLTSTAGTNNFGALTVTAGLSLTTGGSFTTTTAVASTFNGAVTTNGGLSTGNAYAANAGDYTKAGILFYGSGATAVGFTVTGAPSMLTLQVAGANIFTAQAGAPGLTMSGGVPFNTGTGLTTIGSGGLTSTAGTNNFGTIASGTWNGTVIGVAYGGTGAVTAAAACANIQAAYLAGNNTFSGANTFNTSVLTASAGITVTAGGITVAGSSSFSTSTAFAGGITFGNTAVTGATLSSHIALYSTTYGINVISNNLQLVANGGVSLQATNAGCTIPGTLTVTGATTLNGNVTAGPGIQFTNRGVMSTTAPTQGGYLFWNRSGTGAISLINQRGLGSGGIEFGEVDTSGNVTQTITFGYTGNLTAFGNVFVGGSTSAGGSGTSLNISGAVSTYRGVYFQTTNSTRWQIQITNTAEGGGNAGSDFKIGRFSDTATYIDDPIVVSRATGLITLSQGFTGTPNAPTAAGGTNTTQIASTAFANSSNTLNTVTVTASMTLTIAQCFGAVLYLSGSPAAAFTITMPVASNAVRAFWFVYNQTGQTATIAGTSGGTVAVSAGVGRPIWTDGTGIYPSDIGATAGVTSFNTRTGAVTLASTDISGASGILTTGGTFSGAVAFSAGINCGSVIDGANYGNWSKHIALYSTTYGIGVTSNRLNIGAPSGAGVYLGVNAIDVVTVLTGGVTIGVSTTVGISTTASTSLFINGATGTNRGVVFQNAGNNRWTIFEDSSTDSANAGSNLYIGYYNDAGTYTGSPIVITRLTGYVTVNGQLTVGSQINANSTINLANNVALTAFDSGGTQRNVIWINNATPNNVYCLGSPSPAPTTKLFYCSTTFGAAANTTWLGGTTAPGIWAAVGAVNGTIQTSDVALKQDIRRPPSCLDLVRDINPIVFRWKAKQRWGAFDRDHWGFDADNVRDTMARTGLDFGGYIGPEHEQPIGVDPDTGEPSVPIKSLNYSQMVAVLWRAVQELSAEVALLKGGNDGGSHDEAAQGAAKQGVRAPRKGGRPVG